MAGRHQHSDPPCPIKQGDYNTGLVPFTILDSVDPGTYAGTIQVTDQTGATIFLTSWQIVLEGSNTPVTPAPVTPAAVTPAVVTPITEFTG